MIGNNVAMPENHHHCCCGTHSYKRISWTAIIVGALVALGLGFLLNLFGIAIGLSAMKPMSDGSSTLAIGGLIGITVGVIASMLAAGYATGYLGRMYCPQRNMGIVYGFTTWVVALILSASIVGLFSNYVSSYTQAISRTEVNAPAVKVGDTATISAPSSQNPKGAVVSMNVSKTQLVSAAFMVFGLFFIGAVFSCLGACWGMCCRRED